MKESRSYQKGSVDKICLVHQTPGIHRTILAMPTGSGKTHTAMLYVARARKAGVKKILFVVHRDELKQQV